MADVQDRLLESKMTEIEQARSWSPRVISKFETLIRSGDDLSLYRVNPLAFARDRAIAEAEAVDRIVPCSHSGAGRELRPPRCHASQGCRHSQSTALQRASPTPSSTGSTKARAAFVTSAKLRHGRESSSAIAA